MTIDFLASESQFLDHLWPIWDALPERGSFITRSNLQPHAYRRGIETTAADGSNNPILVASYGDVKRARKDGRTHIARIEHGAGQAYVGSDHGSYAGGKDNHDVSLFLVPNQYSADKWQTTYPKVTVTIVGSPRLDTLPAREPDGQTTICISFHWEGHLSGPLQETTGAMTHYRSVLPELAKAFHVIGHGHPRSLGPIGSGRLHRLYRRADIDLVEDFHDVCRKADLYIADNSSSLFEFAATGRPVVVLNAPWYRKDVNHGLRFWDAANVGIQVDEPGQLVAAIRTALDDPIHLRRNREAAVKLVYAHRTDATQRAVTALQGWAMSREEQAA